MKHLRTLALLSLTLAATPLFAEEHAHWGYKGHGNPGHWAELNPDFKACAIGKHQSPINIETRKVKSGDLPSLSLAYSAGEAEVINNGHTIQVNLKAGGDMVLDGKHFHLLQFHFHTPSEEKINGKAYPLVAHFVHKDDDGNIAVIAQLFTVGKENAALKPVFASLPGKQGERTALAEALDPAAVLTSELGRYVFAGSLTTPPCSEEVRWQVLKTPVTLSRAQLKAFQHLYPMNARPVQPLNDRVVQGGQ